MKKQPQLEKKQPQLDPLQLRRIAHWPTRSQSKVVQAWQGKLSPRQAIALACCECCGYDHAEAKACLNAACVLHKYRPT